MSDDADSRASGRGRKRRSRADKTPFHVRVAESLIKRLEAGTAPWQRPWADGPSVLPHNPVSGTRYRGINVINLLCADRSDPRWLTYRQAEGQGAQVRKGERGTPVQYWKFWEEQSRRDDEGKVVLGPDGKPEKVRVQLERPRAFYATVFNAEQIEGLPALARPTVDWEPAERAEAILTASGARIEHGGDRAFYSPRADRIQLPDKSLFPEATAYYATALHELGHWTGHESRLDRDILHPFGSEAYAREELRAELASMLLGAELGVGHDPAKHAAYVDAWVRVLRKDPHEIFRAATAAEDIRGFVLGLEQTQELSQQQAPARVADDEHAERRTPLNDLPRTYIDVPFSDNQHARAAGARWDRAARCWYLPPGADQSATERWPQKAPDQEPEREPERSERQYLAVPYAERKAARQAGAEWDRSEKAWYVRKDADLEGVSRWLPTANDPTPAMDPREEFGLALKDLGLSLGDSLPVMDGQKHRVPLVDDKRGERGGFYVGFPDGHPAGYGKNHRSGREITWKAKGYSLSDEQRAQLKAQAAEQRAERKAQQERRYDQAAERVRTEIAGLAPATLPTPYMVAKKIGTHPGVLVTGDGTLVVPAQNTRGEVRTAQYVRPDGTKRFAKGAQKSGCFHVVGGRLQTADALLIAEGYATAATAAELLGRPVVAAFDAGNLEPVAKALHDLYPDRPIVLLSDDDRARQDRGAGNPGREAADKAAAAVGGEVVSPLFAPGEQQRDPKTFTDFNDLASQSVLGREGARRQLQFAYHRALSRSRQVETERSRSTDQRQQPRSARAGR